MREGKIWLAIPLALTSLFMNVAGCDITNDTPQRGASASQTSSAPASAPDPATKKLLIDYSAGSLGTNRMFY